MNKILNINLGGYALTIDDDAHEYLEKYLSDIRRRFSETEGRDEIMRDVETRMGELISQGMGSRTIVMLPDVESAAHVMGKPEDFGEEQPAKEEKKSAPGGGSSMKGKRLFRDEDDAIIGGVCSGLAAYVGMPDTMWMRFIFILLAVISAGFWIPVYFLLWLIVPAAASTSDRLSMRGQAVTVENIARELEKGAQRVGNQFGPAV